ncbi:heavy metal-binding protein HIP-like [Ostrea edulis]|uniref:heavy metal-binding protein HIP-like n=1 Tax=Ostrea edulis TaxID=37623 RepID=UPI0024AF3383|nr:heavy metal-binding protein HIP-like [Ostrea edulis]
MIPIITLRVTLILMVTLTELYAKETTHDFVSKYNKYNIICRGMGYERKSCNGRKNGAIAFHTQLASSLKNLSIRDVVLFRKVSLNSGSGYNNDTGKFTAPTDGTYYFTWTMETSSGSYFMTQLVINGNMVRLLDRSRAKSASTSALIKMKKNDKVWIRTPSGGNCACYNSSFSGFQL